MKLLLVEDNLESAQLLVRLFTSLGYHVVHTTHGLDGLRIARDQHFDAVLLDFNLPDIDGSQIGLLLRSIQKTVTLIAITAQCDKITHYKAKLFGFDAFVEKPWSIVELVTTVQGLIERRSTQSQIPQINQPGAPRTIPQNA